MASSDLIISLTCFTSNFRSYGWGTPEKTRGSNHIRYLLSNLTIRLTTNAPISYVVDEVLFEVDEPLYLVLMPDDSLKQPLSELAESYLVKTTNFWKNWTRALTVSGM